MKIYSKSGYKSQAGVHLVLLSIFISVLLTLCALALGIGFMVLDNIKFQNVTNAAALAALNSYLEQNTSQQDPQSDSLSQLQRVNKAITAARAVFQNNSFYSGNTYVADNLVFSTGTAPNSSKLEFGTRYSGVDSAGVDHCNKNFPCFVVADPYTSPDLINSVKLTVHSSDKDTFTAPFTKVAGLLTNGLFKVSKSSLAFSEPKCVSLLLDVSRSSFQDSHEFLLGVGNLSSYDSSTSQFNYPIAPGVFAYDKEYNCTGKGGISPSAGDDATLNAYWCDMKKNPDRSSSKPLHARTDYQPVSTRRGQYLADVYLRPEPIKSYMEAINGFLQDYSKTIGFQDRLAAYIFDDMNSSLTPGGFIDRIPEYGTGANSYKGLNETGFLTQLFNIENIGTVDITGNHINQVHPNMLDRGWFPDISSSNPGRESNLPLAIRNVMGEMNTFCSPESNRSIIVASNGLFKKGYADDGSGSSVSVPLKTFADYKTFTETKILSPGPFNGNVSIWNTSILHDALKWGFSLSFITGSRKQQVNFCNRYDSKGKFLPLSNMFLAGNLSVEDGICSDPNAFAMTINQYPESSPLLPKCSATSSECAYKYFENSSFDKKDSSANLYFRYPNYLFAKLAFESSGVYCPILPKAPDGEYGYNNVPIAEQSFTPKQLQSTNDIYKRVENQPQYWRTEDISNVALGASCLRRLTAKPKAYLMD